MVVENMIDCIVNGVNSRGELEGPINLLFSLMTGVDAKLQNFMD